MSHNNNNNNKRKNDNEQDIIDDNYTLKKQKINNSGGDEKVSSGGEIDITNLSKQTVIQLRDIASKLGVSLRNHGIGKNDIIEKIKIVYKRKQNILDTQEYDKNLNSFNKKEIIEIKIKDGIDPLEMLFWKVFRNIFLYKKIMSNMDTHLSTPYHSIISVENMMKFNQLNLLRDKVIRNQYLVFGVGENTNEEHFNEIFKLIRNDDDQDRLFYQQLFKHYGQYSFAFNNRVLDKEDSRSQIADEIIRSNCIPALQVLIQHYQYIPTIDNLNQSIFPSLKLFKVISATGLQLDSEYIKSLLCHSSSRGFKLLTHFYDEKLMDIQTVNQKIKEMILGSRIQKFTLKSLTILSKLILKCNNQTGNTTKSVTNEEIESFSNSLTKKELKSTLSNKSNHIGLTKEMIKKLIEFYYSFLNINKPQFYYMYFSDGSGGTSETFKESDENSIQTLDEKYFSYFEFADLSLDSKPNNYLEIMLKRIFKESKEPDLLFSHCQDKETQMKFINLVISKIKEGDDIINPVLFFYLVIYNDDLDQIKYISKELGGTFINKIQIEKRTFNFISNYIRSKLVLEWLFENHYSLFTSNGSVIWYFKSVELLQHYEKLYKLKYNETITLSSLLDNDQLCNVEILKHVFKTGLNVVYNYKIPIYKEEDGEDDEEYDEDNENDLFLPIIISNYSEKDKFELLKLLYLNFGGMNHLLYYMGSSSTIQVNETGTSGLTKFFYWFYLNYQNEKNKYEMIKENSEFGQFLLKSGIFNQHSKEFCLQYILNDQNESSIQYLDFLLKDDNSFTYQSSINQIISNACFNGKLNTIIHIYQNYSWLLKSKSKSNPKGLFTTKELNQFLLDSLKYNHMAISDYFFGLQYSITKKQFHDCAGEYSKLFYSGIYK